jgi:hypothetical protein
MLASFLSLEVPKQLIVRFLVLLAYVQLKKKGVLLLLFVDQSRGQHQQLSLSPPKRRPVELLPAGDPLPLPCPLPSLPHHLFFCQPNVLHTGWEVFNEPPQ